MKDEELRDLLRYKLSQTDFPFDEGNWQKAEAKISSLRANRKRRRFAAISISVALIGTAAWLLSPVISEEKTIALNTLPTENKSIETNTNASIAKELNAGKQQAENDEVTEKIIPVNTVSDKRSLHKTSAKNKKESLASQTVYPGAGNSNSISTGNKKDQEVASTAEKHVSIGPSINDEGNTAVIAHNTSTADEQNSTVIMEDRTPVKDQRSVEKEPENSMPTEVAANVVETTEEVVLMDTAADPVAITVIEPITEQKKTIFQRFLTFEGGGTYMTGWPNGDHKEGAGFTPVAGISITQTIDRLAGNAGVYFNMINHLNSPGHEATMTEYGFGLNTRTITITPLSVYYLAIPVKIFYQFNPKNFIGLGCNTVFLMNTRSKVDTYSENTHEPQKYYKKGYVEGFSPFDFQLTASYKREFRGVYGIGAEAFYGLTDVRNNAFFQRNVFERNMGFRLTIYYNLKNYPQ